MDLRNDRSDSTGGSASPERDQRDGTRFTARAPLRAPRKQRFGGRKERHRVHPLVLLRVFDPVDQDYQVFGSEAVYHAWLIRRFDPDIKDLVVRPKPVAYQRLGQRFSAQPDLGDPRVRLARVGGRAPSPLPALRGDAPGARAPDRIGRGGRAEADAHRQP